MAADAACVARLAREIKISLRPPISDDLIAEGWTAEMAAKLCGILDDLLLKIDLLGTLPVMGERPLNMVRGLDHSGIVDGSIVEAVARLENELARIP